MIFSGLHTNLSLLLKLDWSLQRSCRSQTNVLNPNQVQLISCLCIMLLFPYGRIIWVTHSQRSSQCVFKQSLTFTQLCYPFLVNVVWDVRFISSGQMGCFPITVFFKGETATFNQDSVPQTWPQARLWGHFLSWDFLSPDDPSMWQVNKALAITVGRDQAAVVDEEVGDSHQKWGTRPGDHQNEGGTLSREGSQT